MSRKALSSKEVAALLGLNEQTVSRHAERYGGVRIGNGRGVWRFPMWKLQELGLLPPEEKPAKEAA